jgi:hypothetical protein
MITSNGGQSPYALAVGDFNGGGKPDVVVTDYLGISILLSNGDGTFQSEVGYPAGAIQVAVCDFNADGRVDITGDCRAFRRRRHSHVLQRRDGIGNSARQGWNGDSNNVNLTGRRGLFVRRLQRRHLLAAKLWLHQPDGDCRAHFHHVALLTQPINLRPDRHSDRANDTDHGGGERAILIRRHGPRASAVVNGKATFSISTLPEGEHLLTAGSVGNIDYSPSVSFVVCQKVN